MPMLFSYCTYCYSRPSNQCHVPTAPTVTADPTTNSDTVSSLLTSHLNRPSTGPDCRYSQQQFCNSHLLKTALGPTNAAITPFHVFSPTPAFSCNSAIPTTITGIMKSRKWWTAPPTKWNISRVLHSLHKTQYFERSYY